MKRVMLVDDEILFRESIRDCIHWEQEGFEYCGDASDGEIALPLIEQWMPDILITDIKMPFMNGLELSSIVRKRMPDIKIIILSGHDEFEYARSALRIGVDEYCMKPVSAADIIQQLHQISEKIDSERQEKERINKLTQIVTNQTLRTQDMLLADLCSGFITTAEAIHAASLLSLHLIAKYYTVMITDFRNREDGLSMDTSLLAQIEAKFECDLKKQVEFLAFKRIRTEKVWVLQGNTEEQLQLAINSIQEEYGHLDEGPVPIELSFGIGNIQDRLQGIHDSYLEAEDDKHWRRLTKQNRHDFSTVNGDSPDHTISLDHNVFIEFLKFGSPTDIRTFIEQFASGLKRLNWNSSFYGYYILNDLTYKVFQSVKETFRNSVEAAKIQGKLQKQIETVNDWEKAFIYLTNLAEQYWLQRKDAADKYTEMLEQVKEYIRCHYHNNQLSLLDAAESVCVSPSHLSKIFSQETGQTFIEYVTHIRIRKAMDLLRSTHAKSYEIAYQVGYHDAHYFSNLFKKSTGMTTKEFRRNDTFSIQASGTGGS
ncbi:response regulator [Paenibacillus sp. FA6]|uniref:response regulator n=1 Tax=Paenibacillus sp. FA6 TaxID=3413029 RepID=UPI003F66010D